MPYQLEFRSEALDDLRGMDKAVAQRVLRRLKWLAENLDFMGHEELSSEFSGLFKFRVGSYGVIYDLNPASHMLIVHRVGHRSEVYKRK